MRDSVLKCLGLLGVSLLLSACSKGGELTLEPGARIVKSSGSPYVSVNQGGKALIVEQGQSATTGVHGWVTIQAVSARNLSSGDGHQLILNKSSAYQ